jgi:hypothetical protein
MLEGGREPKSRIAYAFRLATARKPSDREVGVLSTLFDSSLKGFREDRQSALKLLAVGESPRDRRLGAAELAAYTTVASVIFNLDETITKQ